jgi:hypothetical protein
MHTDEEWLQYLQSQTNGGLDADKYMITAHSTYGHMVSGMDEDIDGSEKSAVASTDTPMTGAVTAASPPVFEDLNISTKTKVL